MNQTKPTCSRTFMGVFLIVAGILWACNPEPREKTTEAEKPADTEKPAETPATKIDAKADSILRGMSATLAAMNRFSFKAKGFDESVDSTGKKMQHNRSGEIMVQRPDRIRCSGTGVHGSIDLYYNKNTFTIYAKKANKYAIASAPNNIDQTMMVLEDSLDIYIPASDLLYADVYKVLTEDAVSGSYAGQSKVGDVMCDHLAFQGKDVDWEIWVDPATKLPRSYLIKSKGEKFEPVAGVEITEWNTNPAFKDDVFFFTPPKGAKKIEFLAERSRKRKQNQTK